MFENNYNLGVRPDVGEMCSAGIAYVVIPTDVDRDRYIGECYKTSTVSIYSEFNGYTNRVPIDAFTLNFIEFPKKVNELGTAVSFLLDPIHKRPIIVGKHHKQDELSDLKENQFKFKRELNGNVVELVGSPDGKYLGINVSTDKAGEVFINVKSTDESGKVNINVDGECNITALTDTILKQYGKLKFITVNREDDDEYTVEEHTSIGRTVFSEEEKINTNSFTINDGKENFVLGQLFKQFLKDFINEVSGSSVMTPQGQFPLVNSQAIAAYAEDEKIDDFLSKIGFIDK
jgi:hypothetical protein